MLWECKLWLESTYGDVEQPESYKLLEPREGEPRQTNKAY